jgi:RNA-binding protein
MIVKQKEHSYIETLSSEQKAKLKALAHALKPIIQVGNQGLSENLTKELILALNKHELIKVQLPADTNAQTKNETQNQLVAVLPKHAHIVSRIGRTVILYLEKKPDEQQIKLK